MTNRLLKTILFVFLLSSPAYSMTYYYVDPNYNGSTRDGGETTPWRDTELNWTTIQSALNSDNVTVYFSCANYAGNAEKTSSTQIDIRRGTDTTYRLTVDGNSYYNTSQTAPASWSPNPGSYRYYITTSDFVITMEGTPYPGTPSSVRSKITIKGFHVKATNSSGRGIYIFGINDGVVTQNYVDTCSIYHIYSCRSGQTSQWSGSLSGFTLSYNTVTGPTGNEAIYLGGQDNSPGCTGVYQDDWIIEYNTISGATNGDGDGDGLDLKAGKRNLIVRYNESYDNEEDGIVGHSGGTFYGNIVHDNHGYGSLRISGYAESGDPWGIRPSDITMYNNLVYDNDGNGLQIAVDGGDAAGTVRIYNNTIYNNGGTGISIDTGTALYFKNNIVLNDNVSISGIGTVYSATNDIVGSSSYGSINQDPLFVSTSTPDFSLQAGSPCIGAGTNLASEGGFSIDIDENTRITWDIGAYEYTSGELPAKAKNVTIKGAVIQ